MELSKNFIEKYKKPIIYSTLGLVVAYNICGYWPFRSVPTGSRGVVTQFGKILEVEPEGLVVLPPWKRLDLFSIRAERADIENAEGSTEDTQAVHVSLTVRYAISPEKEKIEEVFEKYSHDGNLSSYIETATQEVFKAVTAKYKAPDLINKRSQVSTDIFLAMRDRVKVYGAKIISIDIRSFKFSTSYTNAINEKVTQEQLKLLAENKLKTVEAEQKQKVAIAEAEAHATRVRAEGEAYANLTLATAQANSLKIQSQALAQNKDILELRRIEVDKIKAERWNGALPQNMYANAPMPFLNLTK